MLATAHHYAFMNVSRVQNKVQTTGNIQEQTRLSENINRVPNAVQVQSCKTGSPHRHVFLQTQPNKNTKYYFGHAFKWRKAAWLVSPGVLILDLESASQVAAKDLLARTVSPNVHVSCAVSATFRKTRDMFKISIIADNVSKIWCDLPKFREAKPTQAPLI